MFPKAARVFQEVFFLLGLFVPMTEPTSTMMTIKIARAIMPVVSPETETRVGEGVGVGTISFSTWWLVRIDGVAEAARAESNACKTPARKITATRKILRIRSEWGTWGGFMFLPSITETCLCAAGEINQKHPRI
jgi:hypothetical protein